jgi:hypothetical protein
VTPSDEWLAMAINFTQTTNTSGRNIEYWLKSVSKAFDMTYGELFEAVREYKERNK